MRSADLSLNAKGSSVFALGLLFLSAALSACSARVVRVADEMMETILKMRG